MTTRIPCAVPLLAARLMTCHFPCGSTPDDVRAVVESLVASPCPWPVPPEGFLSFGFVDPRLMYRGGRSSEDLDVRFLDADTGDLIRVSFGSLDRVVEAAGRWIEECGPYPREWHKYALLVRARLAEEMARREGGLPC